MKIENKSMLVFGLVMAALSLTQANQTIERLPSSLVSGTTTGARANPYSFSQIETQYGSALYNEQVFRQSQSNDDMLMQALKVERAGARANNQSTAEYDKKLIDLENKMMLTRLQQGYNLNNSMMQMLLTYSGTRHGLSKEQLQVTNARLQQMASLQYINASGTGALYEMPTLESPGLIAQVGANGNKYAPLPTVEIPSLEEDVPDDIMDNDAPTSPLVAIPQEPSFSTATFK